MPIPGDNIQKYIPRIGPIEVAKHRMTFGRAEQLSQFEHFRFFSPAIPYLYGRFNDEPLADFIQETGEEIQYLWHRFDRPLFRGMQTPDGDKAWNHVLWGIEARHWKAFENFMLSVVFMDTPAQRLYSIGVQDVRIVDPLWMQSIRPGGLPPFLPLAVFGVDSNVKQIGVTPHENPIVFGPQVSFHEPTEKMIRFAAAAFSGDNPMDTPQEDAS